MTIADIVIACLYAVLAAAAVEDIWRLRISNMFPILVIALFAAWVVAVGPGHALWQNGCVFLFTLIGGIVLFSLKWLGGGDVKLLAALGLWFDFTGAGQLYLYVALAGGILGLGFIVARRLLPRRLAERSGAVTLEKKGPIPYGLAIAGGAALAIALGAVSPRPAAIPFGLQQIEAIQAGQPAS